ncbi:hypothetical protein D3C73_1298990 [compost metagenome]
MGFWLELMPPYMNIDLLIAVAERQTSLAEGLQAHAQHADIEVFTSVDIDSGQHQVVQMVNHFAISDSVGGLGTCRASAGNF